MPDTGMQAFETLETLSMLLAVTDSVVVDEWEYTRLIATGIPSLLRCSMSGMALRPVTGVGWHLALQQQGQMLPAAETAEVLLALDLLFEAAVHQGSTLIAYQEDASLGCIIPPALLRFGVRCLTVVPLRTLHRQVGMLLVGTTGVEPLAPAAELALRTVAGTTETRGGLRTGA